MTTQATAEAETRRTTTTRTTTTTTTAEDDSGTDLANSSGTATETDDGPEGTIIVIRRDGP